MNIIFAVIIFAAALTIRVKYRPRGRISNRMFILSLMMGVAAWCSSPSFSGPWMSAATLLCLAGYAVILAMYAADSRDQHRRRVRANKKAPSDAPAAAYRTVRLRGGRVRKFIPKDKELGYAG